MSSAATPERACDAAALVALPARPAWLARLVAGRPTRSLGGGALRIEIVDGDGIVLLRATRQRAAALSDAALRSAVRRVYARLGRLVAERGASPWRFWNYVPQLLAPATLAENRYQVFNAGRFEALRAGRGGRADFAAASAVGHAGDDLVVEALAGRVPGEPVDNPLQRSPWLYSARWGPRPPCFARATRVPGAALGADGGVAALVSGTASILGEDSQHVGDVDAQLDRTCRNLDALAAAIARGTAPAAWAAVRAYVADAAHAARVARALARRFPHAEREVAVAALCRTELRVEIEGLAQVDG